jgi:hypothetical protein
VLATMMDRYGVVLHAYVRITVPTRLGSESCAGTH